MVGCHRGLIDECEFVGKEGYSQSSGPQTKGGSSQITIRDCRFQDAGSRAVNVGGSTGLHNSAHWLLSEAKEIVVEGCTFAGMTRTLAFVGVDGAVARYNTIYHPRTWVLRILQETREPGFVECRNGQFVHNLVVYRRAEIRSVVNVGDGTARKHSALNITCGTARTSRTRAGPNCPLRRSTACTTETRRCAGSDPLAPQDPIGTDYGAAALPDEGSDGT